MLLVSRVRTVLLHVQVAIWDIGTMQATTLALRYVNHMNIMIQLETTVCYVLLTVITVQAQTATTAVNAT